jgi:hypothetical protein
MGELSGNQQGEDLKEEVMSRLSGIITEEA